MDQNSLVSQLVETGARFLDRLDETYPVAAAFWLKDRNESKWYLHIFSPKISDGGLREAYGEVLRITREMKGDSFDPFNVKLWKMDNAIVQFANDMQRRFPGRTITDYYVPNFVGVDVEGIYFYPHSIKAAIA